MINRHDEADRGGSPLFEAVHIRIGRQGALSAGAALLHSSGTLSWAELEAQANRLAHRLIKAGVRAEVRVGVSLERGCDMIVALLAVLKAGGAFVPLDPGYPPERLRHMRTDAAIAHVITHSTIRERHFNLPELTCLCLDQPDWQHESSTAPDVAIHPNQLAYLIYTSGSTGQPKGVAVEHGPLAAHCQAIGARYGISAQDRVLHFASINFDLAHEYWLMPLMHGASLLITDQELWTPAQTCAQLAAHGVTVAAFPPAYLNQMAHWLDSQQQTLELRVCAFGGEAMARENFALIRRRIPAQRLINGYGPTETVISPLLWIVSAHSDEANGQTYAYLPIGTAVGNRSTYILDEALNLVPPGVAGELYIGGFELARGYHARPGLTAERFVPDPFGTPGSRLYRTGDLARLRADGNIEYLGRLDHQVKIRGLRIELGEIEAQLLAHPAVSEVAVVAWPGESGARLVGYVTGQDLKEDGLRAYLLERLPDYMVPAQVVLLAQLPRNANGKLDRAALPQPAHNACAYRAPHTELEQALAAIWQEVLKLPQVGLDDNFFALGGHSLMAMQVQALIKERLLIDLPIRVFFESPTLAGMAQLVAQHAGRAQQDETQALSDMEALLNELEH
jgi:amino acid adenylation domain-containing protein